MKEKNFERSREVKIVQIDPGRWEEYKALQIEAVTKEPLAFLVEDMRGDLGTDMEEVKNMSREDVVKNLEAPFNINVAAEIEGKFVAMASGRSFGGEMADIGDVYVSEESRGQGVGKKMMEDLIAKLKEKYKDLERITLTVYDDQQSAVALYKSLGFEIVQTSQTEGTYQGRHLMEHVMELKLPEGKDN